MRYLRLVYAVVFLVYVLMAAENVLAQGSLVPPNEAFTNGLPAATMKTLDQLEPRRPIYSLPFIIDRPGSYYLTASLEGSNGIVIAADDVQLDFNGFSIRGLPDSGDGISVAATNHNEVHNISIYNGAIIEWGEWAVNATNLFDGEVRNLKCYMNSSGGMRTGNQILIKGCAVGENGGPGIVVGDGSSISKCHVTDNEGSGIIIGIGARVSTCMTVSNEGDGMRVGSYSTVSDCLVGRNWTNGVVVSDNCMVMNNNCVENGVTNAPGAGILIQGRGSRVEENNLNGNYYGLKVLKGGNRIENNNLIDNTVGMEDNGGNLVVRNSVGGSATNFNLSTNSQYGVILKDMGVAFTNSNPWANFELPAAE
ncbi:MAG: hypothetical protein KAH23_05990 [Kiritimatiellae bacterium]|nr:hypothetical protein [Kiritimatiellia bacterium]